MGFELNKLLSIDLTIYGNDRTGNNARLVPRPLPDLDFIAQLCRKMRDKIWEWPGDEARTTLG